MSKENEEFSTEIVQRGVENNGPNDGPISFSVRVRPRMPDFLSSVNLKYVKLGYGYLISHRLYLLLAPPLLAILINHIGKFTWEDLFVKYNITEAVFISGLLFLMLYFYIDSTPRSTYLLDFSCFRPSNEYKVISNLVNMTRTIFVVARYEAPIQTPIPYTRH
jgi:3-ketoacyl-CoA synthase